MFAIRYHPSVCLSSVTFVSPTQVVQIFGNISTALGILAIRNGILHNGKCYGNHYGKHYGKCDLGTITEKSVTESVSHTA